MADLVFRKDLTLQSGSVPFIISADNIIRSTSAPIPGVVLRDIVKVTYLDGFKKSIYGICTNESTGEITFDENIYSITTTSPFTAEVYTYAQTDIYDVSDYRISVDVDNGLYSKSYIRYSNTTSYNLITPLKRSDYFGKVSLLAQGTDLAFADYCKNVAYGIGFSGDSFDTLNNKFKSSLEFNIATR